MTDAYGAARSAAAEYVRRRTQLRGIEGSVVGQPECTEGQGMSKACWRHEGPERCFCGSAAQMDSDLSEAMSLIKHAISIEPQNARLHARARLYAWQRSSMCRLWII